MPTVRVPLTELRKAVTKALDAHGVPPAEARLVSDVLIDAERRGHASHGVGILPTYLERVRRGGIRPGINPVWIRSHGAVRLLDARGCFGQVSATIAAATAAEIASATGIGAVGVRNGNHIGMLAAYRAPFQNANIVGLILSLSGPSVVPPNARRPAVGNDALCAIVPRVKAGPLVVDFATGVVACGKIRERASRGEPIPEGWLLGRDGKNSLDAIDLDEGGGVPIFGSWKGLCVQVIVEVLAGMLGGHTISPDVRRQRRDPGELQGTSQLFLALNPRHFGGPDLDHLVGRLRTTVCEAYDDPLGARFPDDLETTHERSRTWTDLPDSLANALGIDE